MMPSTSMQASRCFRPQTSAPLHRGLRRSLPLALSDRLDHVEAVLNDSSRARGRSYPQADVTR